MAEDNPINQEVALTILGKHGIWAEAVPNGREALKALENTDYDIVLMDLQMPEMDGLEATRRIRDRSSRVINRSVPIIAMTANAMKADEDRCWEAGMDDYLTKPVQPADLLEKIDHWLKAVRETDVAGSPRAGGCGAGRSGRRRGGPGLHARSGRAAAAVRRALPPRAR